MKIPLPSHFGFVWPGKENVMRHIQLQDGRLPLGAQHVRKAHDVRVPGLLRRTRENCCCPSHTDWSKGVTNGLEETFSILGLPTHLCPGGDGHLSGTLSASHPPIA